MPKDTIDLEGPFAPVSGLYTRSEWMWSLTGMEKRVVESIRLDVDGSYPQMIVSGSFSAGGYISGGWVDWLATRVTEIGHGVWGGDIYRRWGDTQLIPQVRVQVQVPRRSLQFGGSKMTVTFTGGTVDVTRVLDFESPYFRTVEYEFDTVETAPRVTMLDTWSHPDRPANLPHEQLTISQVYDRAGVDVQQSPNASIVGLEAGVGAEKWNDQELHDAMQVFWSRYKARAQWAMWTLFAHRHVDPLVGGVMFDSSRRNPKDRFQRQGAAVFGKALADRLPPGEKYPDPWIRRQRFFTAVHEIGHSFNLLHSSEKHLGEPWMFMAPDAQARSFMNYPQDVENFYASFEYRFDGGELAFIRHAPEEFVEMGGAAAGTNHGFRTDRSTTSALTLHISVGRSRRVFQFLEPISVELTLTNTSRLPQIVPASVQDEIYDLTLAIESSRASTQKWRPFSRRCTFSDPLVLQPKQSLTASLFVSAGLDGWYLSEPGSYTLRASIDTAGGVIFAEPLTVRIASPQSWDEEELAQAFFTDEVGRALAFGGTHVMGDALATLHQAVDCLKDRAVGRHASLTLALPLMYDRKVLRVPQGEASMSSVGADGGRIESVKANAEEARALLNGALISPGCPPADTFGEGPYRGYLSMYSAWLGECGEPGLPDHFMTVD